MNKWSKGQWQSEEIEFFNPSFSSSFLVKIFRLQGAAKVEKRELKSLMTAEFVN